MICWPSQVTRARLGVEPQGPALDLALGVARGAAHLRAHARQQLLHVEGLGEIVVGAGVHAGDLVAPAIARGEDDDRHLAVGAAPLLEDGDAVHLRQADVEDDDVVGLGVAEEVALLAVGRGVDGVARIGQRRDELAVQILVILNDQDAHVSLSACLMTCRDYSDAGGAILGAQSGVERHQRLEAAIDHALAVEGHVLASHHVVRAAGPP